MKKLVAPVLIGLCFLLSGCTIAQFTYIRNLTEFTADVYFDFDAASVKAIPDSIFVPFAPTSHPINSNTMSFMTDSVVAKRYTNTTLLLHIPSGGMIMFDKTTSRKIGYITPEKLKVKVGDKEPYTVKIAGPVAAGERLFQTKGNSPKIYWHDIY